MTDDPSTLAVGEYFADPNREAVGLPPIWTGAGGGGADPHIDSLDPPSLSAASPAQTITLYGSNFTPEAVIEIDQVAVPTNADQDDVGEPYYLTTQWDPTVARTYIFTVRQGAQESNSFPFTVDTLAADDVAGWTVDEVKDFIRAHPELLAEVTAFERAGSARVTLLDWLQTLLDEEAG